MVLGSIPLLAMAIGGIIYGLSHNIAGEPVQNATSLLADNFSTSGGTIAPLFGAVVATAFAFW